MAPTPAPTGIPRPTSTWSAGSSMSGSMAARSCTREPSCLIPSLRRQFNQAWSPQGYARFLQLLQRRCGETTLFRHSETPCFLPSELVGRMARYGCEMVDQLLASPEYQRSSREAVPPAYRVPREDPLPLFVQADFGLDENLEPKLVEIQGFPSLYAYQPVMAEAYRQAYGLDPALHTFLGGLTG